LSEGEIRVWCLLGKKAGDNTQTLALADELGLGYSEKHIVARPWELLVHLAPVASLAGIDRGASSDLSSPWPHLVITAGRRNEPVAHWIRARSGGRTRLVHIGRPWSSLDRWDLIVTTPQYFLPRNANIVHNELPLHRLSADGFAAAAAAWRPRFNSLPRPWIAVLVGGDSGRYVLTATKGARLGALSAALARQTGGSLLVAGSPRTPAPAAAALQAALAAPNFCYRWGDPGDNPYRAMLALADAFVVTGESMSMLAEAADTERPLLIFDPGDDGPWWRYPHNYRYKPLSHRLAMSLGPGRMRRDVGRIQHALVEGGRARWLGEPTIADAAGCVRAAGDRKGEPRESGPGEDELRRTAQSVRRLVIPR